MKKFVLFLFISCLTLSITKANNVIGSQFLTVSATSGLSMRTAPGLSSDNIMIIPNGAEVEVILRETDPLVETVEWTKGQWTYVKYGERKGYVFDGFLTNLPLPELMFEKVVSDLDLSTPLISWAEHRFNEVKSVDTIIRNDIIKEIKVLANGVILKKYSDQNLFKLKVEIDHIRIMDAYNLLLNMMDKEDRVIFKNNSTFLKMNGAEIDKIKVDIDNPLIIQRLDENRISITVENPHLECGLETVGC